MDSVGESTVWQKAESAAKGAVPLLLTLALMIVCVLPTGLPYAGAVMPMLPLISIYFWAAFRPDLIPLPVSFAVGLLYDGLTGMPLGLSGAVFIAVHWSVTSQRRFVIGKSFAVVWLGFVILASLAAILYWGLSSLLYFSFSTFRPVLFQLMMTIAAYPVLAWLFGRIHRDVLKTP